jgi:hypothetical protein
MCAISQYGAGANVSLLKKETIDWLIDWLIGVQRQL